MIKFIKRQTIISILGLISFLISISYAITYNMPDYFGIEGWYSLLNNISISYIAALMFYIIQVYIPECENRKRAKVILNPLFLDLIKFIEVTIACCRKYVSIEENGTITINWWDKENKIIYFVPLGEEIKSGGHRPAVRKSETDLQAIENIYKSKIKEIKESISFRDCNPDILNALSKLEATDFFKSTLILVLMFEGTFIKFFDFQNSVDQFETIKDELKRCCEITCKYDVRDAENMEIAVSEAIFHKKALQATSMDEFNEIAYREYLNLQLKPLIPNEENLNEIIDSILPNILNKNKE